MTTATRSIQEHNCNGMSFRMELGTLKFSVYVKDLPLLLILFLHFNMKELYYSLWCNGACNIGVSSWYISSVVHVGCRTRLHSCHL